MADVSYQVEPKVEDIANFKHDNRRLVGHLKKFKVGGEELKADFNFVDPMDPGNRVPLCGMITFLQWDKKPGGVLLLEGRLSAANQGIFQDGVDSHDKTAECEVELVIYKYDVATAKYFQCFHTDGKPIEGQLSEDHASTVSDEFADEYKQIKNHRFVLAVIGSDKKDELLHIAYNTERKKTYKFGQACKA